MDDASEPQDIENLLRQRSALDALLQQKFLHVEQTVAFEPAWKVREVREP